MKLVAHQQIEGAEPGDTITVDNELGQWYLDNGYASEPEGGQPKRGRASKTSTTDDQADKEPDPAT